MKPRLYDPSRPFTKPIGFVTTPPNAHILLLGTRADAVKLCLHWVNGLSIPCVEGECPYCHLEVRPYAYAPCALISDVAASGAVVVRALLPVPNTAFDLIDEYNTSIWYEIGRKGNVKSGRLTWKRWQDRRANTMQPFHVLTHLKQLWEKRIARMAPVDLWKQYEGQEETQDAA